MHDLGSSGHTASERELGKAWMLGHDGASLAGTLNDSENAGREACFSQDFAQKDSSQRAERRRVVNERVPRGKGWCHFPNACLKSGLIFDRRTGGGAWVKSHLLKENKVPLDEFM